MVSLSDKIARFIVEEVQKNSEVNGFQCTVGDYEIKREFHLSISEYLRRDIEESLWRMVEVNDVIAEDDGFDVVLALDYAPHYREEDYDEFK